jgi:hypothetical protein
MLQPQELEFAAGSTLRGFGSGSQPGFDSWMFLLSPWLTAAMASGPPAFVNPMVRRWISRQAFGTERLSSPNDFHHRPIR